MPSQVERAAKRAEVVGIMDAYLQSRRPQWKNEVTVWIDAQGLTRITKKAIIQEPPDDGTVVEEE